MIAPTAAWIEENSDVDFASLGNGWLAADGAVQRLVDVQVAFLEWATGRPLATMPPEFERLAEQALIYLVENSAQQSTADISETMGDFALIQSFSAGPYNESRRGLDELRKSGLIVADPRLHGLLWALLTDERRDVWMEWLSGVIAPAFEITDVNWADSFIDPLGGRGVWEDGVYPY